tara:strand:+ start:264 stop:899 length:636 start_codon:yes stop_codon:yes gene_type:complete
MSGILQSAFMNIRAFELKIGDAYEGGFYAGQISTTANGVATHNLVVAPKSSGQAEKKFKINRTADSGTDSAIDGPTNSGNMNDAANPAAKFCEDLTIGGHTDWYMPAFNEQEVQYYFLRPTTASNNTGAGSNANAVSPEPISTNYSSGSPAQTSATLFQSGNSEAFDSGSYWNSTQSGAQYCRYKMFSNGGTYLAFKNSNKDVRAVRRVAI